MEKKEQCPATRGVIHDFYIGGPGYLVCLHEEGHEGDHEDYTHTRWPNWAPKEVKDACHTDGGDQEGV